MFLILGGFFLTNAILAELTGGKLFSTGAIQLGPIALPEAILSAGVIPWPVVFIMTDLVNEYYGRVGVRKLTFLAMGLITYCFVMLYFQMLVPVWSNSPVTEAAFNMVFGQSMWIIVGSLTAFLTSQLVDVTIFTAFKNRTKGRMLWLRATGSTVVSQLVDTFIVGFIGFVVPGFVTIPEWIHIALGSYLYKLLIAIAITPVIYLAHGVIDRYLGIKGAETTPSAA